MKSEPDPPPLQDETTSSPMVVGQYFQLMQKIGEGNFGLFFTLNNSL